MKAQALIHQLRREAAANKGKAVALGLTTVVALYFWAPLVASWFGGDEPSGTAEAAVAAAPASVPTPAATTGQPNTTMNDVGHSWKDLHQWMDEDPLMESAGLPKGVQAPFKLLTPATTDQDQQTDEDEVALAAAELTPDTLGLVLTSTLVGRQRSIIQISGKTYAVAHPQGGTKIPIAFPTDQGVVRFDVLSVRPQLVVLQRNNKTYTLTMKKSPATSEQDRERVFAAPGDRG